MKANCTFISVLLLFVSLSTSALLFEKLSSFTILGNYNVISIMSEKPKQPIRVNIQQTKIKIKGCNLYSGSYLFNLINQKFSVKSFQQPPQLTLCFDDQDQDIINAFNNSVSVQKIDNILVFHDPTGKQTLRIREISEHDQKQGYFEINGNYEVFKLGNLQLVRSITLWLSGKSIRIKGCNQLWGNYEFDITNGMWSVDQFKSTSIGCRNDQDRYVVFALRKAVFVTKNKDLLVFQDQMRNQLLVVRRASSLQEYKSQPEIENIKGTYQLTQIGYLKPKLIVILTIDGQLISFKGCNTVQSTYKYNQITNDWRSTNFTTTMKTCKTDEDVNIIQALKDSVRAERRGNILIMIDQLGISTLKAKLMLFDKQDEEMLTDFDTQQIEEVKQIGFLDDIENSKQYEIDEDYFTDIQSSIDQIYDFQDRNGQQYYYMGDWQESDRDLEYEQVINEELRQEEQDDDYFEYHYSYYPSE